MAESAGMPKEGTLAQQLKLKELRAEVSPLKDLCRKLDDAEAAQRRLDVVEFRLCLSDELASTFKFTMMNADDQQFFNAEFTRRNPGPQDEVKGAKDRMDILRQMPFIGKDEMCSRIPAVIEFFTNEINTLLDGTKPGHQMVGAEHDRFWRALSALVIHTVSSMDKNEQEKNKGLILDLVSQRAANATGYNFIHKINSLDLKGEPSDWAENMRNSYASLVEEFDKQLAEEKAAREALAPALSAVNEALKQAEKLGLVDGNMKPDHEKIRLEFMENEYALVGLVREIVSSSEKAKAKSFKGLPKERLAELSAFWEAYPEHPAARLNVAKICLESGEFGKALAAVDAAIKEKRGKPAYIEQTADIAMSVARSRIDREIRQICNAQGVPESEIVNGNGEPLRLSKIRDAEVSVGQKDAAPTAVIPFDVSNLGEALELRAEILAAKGDARASRAKADADAYHAIMWSCAILNVDQPKNVAPAESPDSPVEVEEYAGKHNGDSAQPDLHGNNANLQGAGHAQISRNSGLAKRRVASPRRSDRRERPR